MKIAAAEQATTVGSHAGNGHASRQDRLALTRPRQGVPGHRGLGDARLGAAA